MELTFRPSGDRYLTVELGNEMALGMTLRVLALDKLIRQQGIPGVIETVATWRSILVHFDPLDLGIGLLKDMLKYIVHTTSLSEEPIPSRVVEVPVRYGGKRAKDLSFVAEFNNMTEEELVARHSSSHHLVGMISFVPGQANCMFLDRSKIITAPKYQEPRTYTPEGIIGLGGSSTAIYSVASPGGFQMIGYTPVPTYDPWRRLPQFDEPVLLKVADQLKFVPIDDDEMDRIAQEVREAKYEFVIQECVLRP
jgi:inhibitor of KinA